jgi:hypothetical protein
MNYTDIYNILKEEVIKLPPCHQSWHDFNRLFFSDTSSDFKEFVVEYLGSYSNIESFLNDIDNETVKKALDDYGVKFIEAISDCTMMDVSEIVERLVRCLY